MRMALAIAWVTTAAGGLGLCGALGAFAFWERCWCAGLGLVCGAAVCGWVLKFAVRHADGVAKDARHGL